MVCSPSDSALQSLGAGHDPNDKRHEGRFDDANLEMGYSNGLVQTRNEDLRAHSLIKPLHRPASIERGQGTQKRQDRHGDDEGEHPRQDQHLDRIKPHGPKSVNLLPHFHRAEFSGVGAA